MSHLEYLIRRPFIAIEPDHYRILRVVPVVPADGYWDVFKWERNNGWVFHDNVGRTSVMSILEAAIEVYTKPYMGIAPLEQDHLGQDKS
jgi:hypothetical protein